MDQVRIGKPWPSCFVDACLGAFRDDDDDSYEDGIGASVDDRLEDDPSDWLVPLSVRVSTRGLGRKAGDDGAGATVTTGRWFTCRYLSCSSIIFLSSAAFSSSIALTLPVAVAVCLLRTPSDSLRVLLVAAKSDRNVSLWLVGESRTVAFDTFEALGDTDGCDVLPSGTGA